MQVFDKLFKFAFVRNPWDWQVSLYHYMLEKTTHHQHGKTRGFESFDEYIEWRVAEDKWLQKDFVTDEANQMIVDFVGRYERLEEDFLRVCGHLGIEAFLPHVNPSAHKEFRHYYSDHSRRLVAQHFAEDCDLFGYRFDGP